MIVGTAGHIDHGKSALVLALTGDHGAIHAPEDPSGKAEGVRRLDWDHWGMDLEAALQKEWPSPGRPWIVSLSGWQRLQGLRPAVRAAAHVSKKRRFSRCGREGQCGRQ